MRIGLSELLGIIAIVGAIIGATLYVTDIKERVRALEVLQQYSHGDVRPYMSAKEQ